METTYENECTTIQEQKCEIQYMTQYEQQCSTQNENVSNDYGLLYLYWLKELQNSLKLPRTFKNVL